jgi:hypothetical protein
LVSRAFFLPGEQGPRVFFSVINLLAYHTLFTRSDQPLDEFDALPLSSHKRVAPEVSELRIRQK